MGSKTYMPEIQICFPPELGMKNRNVWGEIIEDKYHIMKVKEWLKHKKNMFTIEEDDFTPREIITSRYATKMVNNKFYGVVNIE